MTTSRPGEITRLYGTAPDTGRDGLWAELRERHGPVAPVELETGVRAWLLLGYHENLAVLRNQHLFSRDTRRWREAAYARPAISWRPNALYADGAEHVRLRSAITDSLARVDMNATARTIRRIADELIDSFAARGRADLITEYAHPLPVLVVNSLYGLPDSYGHMLGDLTSIVFAENADRAEDAVSRIQQYFSELVARKHRRPGLDLVSWMLEHPAGLSDHEVAHQAALIHNASHQPTTHLIGNTLHTLLTDTGIRMAYTEARLPVQELLDHVMWTDTPFRIMPARIALQDTRIGGAEIRAGDALLLGFDAAHHDPAVRRDGGGKRAHLLFGAGAHSCPAQELARMITATAVTALQERLAGIRLAVAPGELRWVWSPFLRGLRELPVTFTPDAPAAPPPRRPAEAPETPEDERGGGDEEGDLLGRLLDWWRGLRA
ncbi:cytochrome P450 family protein [Nocardiopsis halotolerans]|uniref:cytochrome P450 n=1 Tax=Nocardiopsis halotolerans TaxID=124252 RepID=UPI000349EBC9|nr:cytochrome P450 [Nocardiopsis halotolerans]